MVKEMEYYLGYLRNPKQRFKDGEDYREAITDEKIYTEERVQVFDGHKVTEKDASFIGRVGKKLETKEALSLMKQIKNNNMKNYLITILKLMQDTRELTLIGEQEYLNELEKVKNFFRK